MAVTVILLITVPTAFLIIYLELKVIARMNLRVGPNRVGPWGAAMSVIHGLKVLAKEDFSPTGADITVFTLAPVVTYLASVMTLLVIPFAPGLFGQDLNIGLLFIFSMSGLTVLGLLMAGWSSFNKYSILGGLRSAAQIISYEIPLTLSVVGVILLAGTMSLNHIVAAQSGSALDWFAFKQPLALLIFFIAATAEANRTPFDMTEADSEIVAGFATEYSGMRFGFFFFAEYVNVFIVSALATTIFFGGWTAPFNWPWPTTLNAFDPFALGFFGWAGIVLAVGFVGTQLLALLVRLFGGRDWTWGNCDGSRLPPPPRGRRGRGRPGRLHRLRLDPRSDMVHGQDVLLRLRLHLDAGHPAASPRRPADGICLEMAAARLASQSIRDGDRRRAGPRVRAR